MEDRKKAALNDELLDKVAGGLDYGECYVCPNCGVDAVYGSHICLGAKRTEPNYHEEEPIARA